MNPSSYADHLIAVGRVAGLDAVGVAPADVFESTHLDLLDRRERGLHGGMEFTYRNPERSTDPGAALAGARSLVVGALRYAVPASPDPGGAHGRVAAYAQRDRYVLLRERLARIADRLKLDGHRARVVADDNALVDREAAVRAGLGWYGKASNVLLDGAGSWFILGSVLTTAALAPSEPMADGCGACRRCIDACPTGAIVAPGVVDARRCLAWLLQETGPFRREFREALGTRIYGCDDCQEVCPPNRRFTGVSDVALGDEGQDISAGTDHEGAEDWVSLVDILTADDAELLERFGHWYVPDRDPVWIRRNALVALGNQQLNGGSLGSDVVESLRRCLGHPHPVLRAQALWSARRLGVGSLGDHLAQDPDPIVSAEWSAP